MIKDNRMKRIGVDNASRRGPSSNLDIIHKNKNTDAQILYTDDQQIGGLDSNLPSIHGSQMHNGQQHTRGVSGVGYQPSQYGGAPRQGNGRFVKPPLHQIYAPNNARNDTSRLR